MAIRERIRERIGRKLKETRTANRETQRSLAKILGVSRYMVIRYEKGKDAPTGEAFAKAIRYIGGLDLPGYRLTAEALERPKSPPPPATQQLDLPLGVPQEFPNTTVRVTRHEESIEIHAVISGAGRR